MLERIKEIVSGGTKTDAFEPSPGIKPKSPKHIAFTIDGSISYSRSGNIPVKQAYARAAHVMRTLIGHQPKKSIPIFTFYLLGKDDGNNEHHQELLNAISDFLVNLSNHEVIEKGLTKVSVIGKWYDLPGRIVDAIKLIIDTTKDNTEYYVNLCINYDGQEEIVDACKLLVRQVMASKIDISQISCQTIKENTYSSYFMPPDLIIKNGWKHHTKGFMLWDSSFSSIYFTDKAFPDFKKSDIDKAIDYWQKN